MLTPHRSLVAFFAVVSVMGGAHAFTGDQSEGFKPRPMSTYSIIARDPETGAFGAAVQTHSFAVGTRVIHVRAGVGAVATQAWTRVAFGPQGLDLLQAGIDAQHALDALLATDPGRESRQVAILDITGKAAGHTGSKTIKHACNRGGDNYSVQANTMHHDTVCAAMANSFEQATGHLGERLLAALKAAQAAGGDVRGQQSAAMQVLAGERGQPVWEGWEIDLRVDDHPQPLVELERLLQVNQLRRLVSEGNRLIEAGDVQAGLEALSKAERMDPDNHELLFWNAVTLVQLDRVEESFGLFSRAFELWPLWRDVLPRLPESDLFPDDSALIERILQL